MDDVLLGVVIKAIAELANGAGVDKGPLEPAGRQLGELRVHSSPSFSEKVARRAYGQYSTDSGACPRLLTAGSGGHLGDSGAWRRQQGSIQLKISERGNAEESSPVQGAGHSWQQEVSPFAPLGVSATQESDSGVPQSESEYKGLDELLGKAKRDRVGHRNGGRSCRNWSGKWSGTGERGK